MPRRIASIGLSFILVVGAGVLLAGAQSFNSRFLDRFDVNKDGRISRDEVPEGTYRKVFDNLVTTYKLDANKTYTRDELEKVMGLGGSSSSPASPPSRDGGRRERRDGPPVRRAPSDGKPFRALVELPDEYRRHDKDGDGQVGLYEWPRDRIADFVKVDKNGDGFLTMNEVAKPTDSTSNTPEKPADAAKSEPPKSPDPTKPVEIRIETPK